MVHMYSTCALTHNRDKLEAMPGLVESIQRRKKTTILQEGDKRTWKLAVLEVGRQATPKTHTVSSSDLVVGVNKQRE